MSPIIVFMTKKIHDYNCTAPIGKFQTSINLWAKITTFGSKAAAAVVTNVMDAHAALYSLAIYILTWYTADKSVDIMYLYIMSNRESYRGLIFFSFYMLFPTFPVSFSLLRFLFTVVFGDGSLHHPLPHRLYNSLPRLPFLDSTLNPHWSFIPDLETGTAVELRRLLCTHSRSLSHMYLYARISWVANVNWKILGYGYQWVCAHCQSGETLGWNCRRQCLQSRLSNSNLAMICLVFWTAPRVGHCLTNPYPQAITWSPVIPVHGQTRLDRIMGIGSQRIENGQWEISRAQGPMCI